MTGHFCALGEISTSRVELRSGCTRGGPHLNCSTASAVSTLEGEPRLCGNRRTRETVDGPSRRTPNQVQLRSDSDYPSAHAQGDPGASNRSKWPSSPEACMEEPDYPKFDDGLGVGRRRRRHRSDRTPRPAGITPRRTSFYRRCDRRQPVYERAFYRRRRTTSSTLYLGNLEDSASFGPTAGL